MKVIHPPPLQKNTLIGVMSPSCWVPQSDLDQASTFMQQQGYQSYIHPLTTERHQQAAGTPEQKVEALHDLVKNSDISVIVGSRGGNRASTMLSLIDYDLLRQNPKIYIGYSDFTALLNGIYAQTGIVTYHAPLYREWPTHPDFPHMTGVITGTHSTTALNDAVYWRGENKEAKGTLIGGNLSVFQSLIGTPYMPDTKGAILFLEDVGDHISRYDRMICHLKNAGILDQLNGLIIGNFSKLKDNDNNPFGFSLQDIIMEHTKGSAFPIVKTDLIGHEGRLITLPVGADIHLKNNLISFKSLS